jgi:O-antigen ligase
MDSAAVNMVMARPLVGFGWNRSAALLGEYMKLSPDRPLSGAGQRVHNLFLGYAADLGLVGLTLWVLGPLVALATVARRRGPPEVRVWKAALAAVAIMFAIVVSFVPPTFFPNLAFWLWAGVVWGCVRRPGEPARHEIGDPLIRR